jgi:chromosome segregation ATPase
MEIISGLMNQPKTQSAEEIIPTLCDRLAHARLASDKRAAILTLKGFSRQYRESVVANGLRGLISTLKKFTIDTDIIKACLETILILFIRGEGDDDLTRNWFSQQSRTQNGKYPSPLLMKQDSSTIDQFSLWIADEITQCDENIAVIVSLLENTDFYVRLYTLQLLEALVSMRATKTKDLLLNCPLGISSLVQVLDDVHDPVRNEAVLLLMAVVNDNFNIQKLVAFENTFDKLFEIIHEEGDIRGSIVVQDCLTLVSNLLKYNVSNQKLFLETNCLPKLSYLIAEPLGEDEVVWNDQRLQNIEIALDIVKLFVLSGNDSTKTNQDAFFNADIFLYILRLAFSPNTPNSLRPHALLTVADLISKNNEIQQGFSDIDVPYIDPSQPKQSQTYKDPVPVVVALLNWCLFVNSVHLFDIRVAASYLLRAYFDGNDEGKANFLNDQIADFYGEDLPEDDSEEVDGEVREKIDEKNQHCVNGEINTDPNTVNGITKMEDELNSETNGIPIMDPKEVPIANIFKALLEYDPEVKLNPYKIWFSSTILIYLISGSEDAKEVVRGVTAGDEESGEEVLSAIQAMLNLLLTTLNGQDERISIGYLMLLIVMLYEDFESVDDFLSESSNLKTLLQFLVQSSTQSLLVQGLVTILIGITFEFSSKDSPIPRVELHALILKILGKDTYGFKISQFKENALFAEYKEEDIFRPDRDETGLPRVFFSPIFVWLIKDNYYRIKNTLNQDPNLGSNGRISYEKFELLQDQYHGLKNTYDVLCETSRKIEENTQGLLTKTTADLEEVSDKLQKAEIELSDLTKKHSELTAKFTDTCDQLSMSQKLYKDLSETSSKQSKELQTIADRISQRDTRIGNLEQELNQVLAQKNKAEDGINKMSRELFQLTKEKDELQKKVKRLEKDIQNYAKQQEKLESSLKQKSDEASSMKAKLDGVLKDLQDATSSRTSIEKALQDEKTLNSKNQAIIDQMTEKLRSIANTCNQLSSSKAELEEELASSHEKFDKELKSSWERVQLMSSSENNLKLLTEKLQEEKGALDKNIELLKAENDAAILKLETDNKNLEEKLSKLNSELEISKTLCIKYEGEIRNLNLSLKKTADQAAELKKSHDLNLKEQSEYHQQALALAKSHSDKQTGALESDMTVLQEKIEELIADGEVMKSDLVSHQYELAETKGSLALRDSELSETSANLKRIQSQVSELQLSKQNLEHELKRVKKDSDSAILSLESTVDELTKVKAGLENELDDLAVELESKEADLRKELTSLSEELSSAEAEKKSLSSTMEMISERIEEKDKESESLLKELKAKASEIKHLEEQLFTMTSERDETEQRADAYSKDIEKLTSDVSDLKEKLESSLDEAENKDQALQALEVKLEESKSKSLEKISALTKEIDNVKGVLEKKLQEFEKERALLSENSSSATKEYSEQVTRLEEELTSLESSTSVRIGTLESERTKLEETISDLTASRDKLMNEIGSKDAKVSELKKSVKDLEAQFKDSQNKLIDVTKEASRAKNLEDKLEKITKNLSFAEDNLKTKENDLKNSNDILKKLKSEMRKLESSKDEVAKKLDGSNSSNLKKEEEYQSTVKKLKNDLSHLSSLKNQLEIDLSKSTDRLSSLEAETHSEKVAILKKVKALEAETSFLHHKLEEVQKSKNEIEAEAVASAEKLTEMNSELEMEIKSLKDKKASEDSKDSQEISSLKLSLRSLTTKNTELENDIQDFKMLRDENSKLNAEILKMKEAMVDKSELDDMILVMEDLDEKKSKYKELAKALGADVSSDEEDEDDDDSEE